MSAKPKFIEETQSTSPPGRWRRRFESNEFIDAQLRRIYCERPPGRSSSIPSLGDLAVRTGWSKATLRRRADELGLGRARSAAPQWSDAELEILEEFAWACADRIAVELRARGYQRSVKAIVIQRQKTMCEDPTGVYSASSLAECFGVDWHTVRRWLNLGYLRAERRAAGFTVNPRDEFAIHRKDVVTFVQRHPNEFDIRRVHQPWFMDLVFNGRICRV